MAFNSGKIRKIGQLGRNSGKIGEIGTFVNLNFEKPQFGYYFVPMCVTLLLTDYKILYITRLEQGLVEVDPDFFLLKLHWIPLCRVQIKQIYLILQIKITKVSLLCCVKVFVGKNIVLPKIRIFFGHFKAVPKVCKANGII